MHAVPQFVGKGHHVAPAPRVVEQHIRMGGRDRRMGERATLLARLRGSVDVAVEEPGGDVGHLG